MSASSQYLVGPVVIVDIEGTTTPLAFVKEVLFPYAREHLQAFLKKNWAFPEVQNAVSMLKEQATDESPRIHENTESEDEVIDSITEHLLWQMDKDMKSTPLKNIQGMIWKYAYETGEILSEVFPDVPKALERWSKKSKIYVYSSGSIEAQKLLFGYTKYGSLLNYFSGYFDTTSGSKIDSSSYCNISRKIGENPQNITFFTDSLKEAEAAKNAGWNVVIMKRPGNPPIQINSEVYKIAGTFDNYE